MTNQPNPSTLKPQGKCDCMCHCRKNHDMNDCERETLDTCQHGKETKECTTLKPQVPSGVKEGIEKILLNPDHNIEITYGEVVDGDTDVYIDALEALFKSHLQAEVEEILTKVETEYAKFYKKKAREYGIKRGVPYTAFHKIIDELKSRLTKQK